MHARAGVVLMQALHMQPGGGTMRRAKAAGLRAGCCQAAEGMPEVWRVDARGASRYNRRATSHACSRGPSVGTPTPSHPQSLTTHSCSACRCPGLRYSHNIQHSYSMGAQAMVRIALSGPPLKPLSIPFSLIWHTWPATSLPCWNSGWGRCAWGCTLLAAGVHGRRCTGEGASP